MNELEKTVPAIMKRNVYCLLRRESKLGDPKTRSESPRLQFNGLFGGQRRMIPWLNSERSHIYRQKEQCLLYILAA